MTLYKIPKSHLISWYGNFLETKSSRRVLGETRKLDEALVFYEVPAVDSHFSVDEMRSCCVLGPFLKPH